MAEPLLLLVAKRRRNSCSKDAGRAMERSMACENCVLCKNARQL
jgi:hypothetical protein